MQSYERNVRLPNFLPSLPCKGTTFSLRFTHDIRRNKSEKSCGQSGQGQNGQNRFREHDFCSLLNRYLYLFNSGWFWLSIFRFWQMTKWPNDHAGDYFESASKSLSRARFASFSSSRNCTNREPIMAPAAFDCAVSRVCLLLIPKPIMRGLRRFMALIFWK